MSAQTETATASFSEPPGEPLHVEVSAKIGHTDFADTFSIETRRFTLDDGSRYDVQHFRPDTPRYDIGATYTTPWCTDIRGFNTLVGTALANVGISTTGVSPERLRPADLTKRLGGLSLLHDVLAHHAILNYIDEKEIAPHAPKQAITVGYSRGAMVGFGLNATATAHERRIRYSDFIDPCLEHKVRLREIDWTDVPGYAAEELMALGRGLSQYKLPELIPLALGAVKPSVRFWLQQLALAKTLFSGEAGMFAEGWDSDSVAHIQLYTGSRFNHAALWRERFAQLGHVHTVLEPGLHLSGVDPKVLRNTVGRVVLAADLIKSGASPAEIHAQIVQWRPPQALKQFPHLPHLPKLKAA